MKKNRVRHIQKNLNRKNNLGNINISKNQEENHASNEINEHVESFPNTINNRMAEESRSQNNRTVRLNAASLETLPGQNKLSDLKRKKSETLCIKMFYINPFYCFGHHLLKSLKHWRIKNLKQEKCLTILLIIIKWLMIMTRLLKTTIVIKYSKYMMITRILFCSGLREK
ncbi:uncharacterized protein LOC126901817 isoform X1 [Daktulosphaira vitifoliae]|uniref:uncharacterized protein LOC126901817 isoform X1 n=1 Tax=Daktulosphaira vitifoliae TaxID=58002 RepID=UPI0021AA446F|nr:uncharacterized protein LOC126901817 isoform X1 [Daktulosphaira vitifoliae]XP_050534585.1 uncharacterized protein LOC126901817 isoform X1 [Daktulosphaira vitifoliae]XP_050534586.1 uncharacterized protein LOC126901817 isoform X1 [Daktulosphaira vitifoliae]